MADKVFGWLCGEAGTFLPIGETSDHAGSVTLHCKEVDKSLSDAVKRRLKHTADSDYAGWLRYRTLIDCSTHTSKANWLDAIEALTLGSDGAYVVFVPARSGLEGDASALAKDARRVTDRTFKAWYGADRKRALSNG